MQTLSSSQVNPEVPINENFDSIVHASCYGKKHTTTTGLTWGYWGGRWGGTSIADGTLSLTNAATNYIVVLRSTGVISVSTTTTNWNNTAQYARVYQLTTAGSVVTATQDHRAGPYGVHGGSSGLGREAIWIPARDMSPSASGGCAPLATIATTANQPDIQSLDFDPSTDEYAQFSIRMPKRWNLGTVTFLAVWSHAATAVNFGVAWSLQGLAVSDNELIPQAYGTAIVTTDTGGTTNCGYQSPESAAVTIAGTPAAEDMVFFRVARVTANAGDTMAIDARLHGIVLFVLNNAENDL